MAINIQNIIDQITAKAAAADSTDTADYLLTLSKATLAMNNATGVIEYRAKSQLPTVDSSILGNFAYIAAGYDIDSVYADSYAGFYYAARIGSNDSGWDRIRTGKDSDIENVAPWSFQGEISGYTIGGRNPGNINVISKYSFVSDGNGTDVGDMTLARMAPSGQSSTTYGYASGGAISQTNVIDKHPFSVDANATDVGDLTVPRGYVAGHSSQTFGYASGGYPNPTVPAASNIIDKFPFSSDANATDVGDLTVGRQYTIGQSSTNYGYTSGGYGDPIAFTNIIDKFPYSSDGNSTDVGDMTTNKAAQAGQNSDTYGYNSGGLPDNNIIEKFSFSSDGNATDVGDLTAARGQIGSGSSSTVSGYSAAGAVPNNGTNIIDKFPFATDANATDVGDTPVLIKYSGSNQV